MGVTSYFFTGFDTAPQEGICVYLVSGLGRSQALGEATVTVSPKHHDVPIRVTSMPTDQCRSSLWPVPSGQNSYCSGQHTANDDCWIPSHDWDIIWPPLSTAWGTPQYKEKGGGRGADSSARPPWLFRSWTHSSGTLPEEAQEAPSFPEDSYAVHGWWGRDTFSSGVATGKTSMLL